MALFATLGRVLPAGRRAIDQLMRDAFCNTLLELTSDPALVFLTGDLGFHALEPLRNKMGKRFINAGVAEQNMVSVAAGLAKGGLRPWVYSIAPFLYARAFEQIRNDVCLHRMPVVLVGNGGGYGYGVMGSTHHAIEDYGVLLSLPSIRVYLPAFDCDVSEAIRYLIRADHPAYLRLGLSEQPKWFSPPPFASWRHLLAGMGPTIAIAGPLAGGILDAIRQSELAPDVWLVSELPITELPSEFLSSVCRSSYLMVIEEHVCAGGFGQMLAHQLLLAGTAPRQFVHRSALGYASGRYGSQRFHRAECGLDPASIVAELNRAVLA
jgi:transketolase